MRGGKENGQWGDERGRSRAFPPSLTPTPPHPAPLPPKHLPVLLDCLTTHEKSANSEWCRLALPGFPGCVWQGPESRRGQGSHAAGGALLFPANGGPVITESRSCAQ